MGCDWDRCADAVLVEEEDGQIGSRREIEGFEDAVDASCGDNAGRAASQGGCAATSAATSAATIAAASQDVRWALLEEVDLRLGGDEEGQRCLEILA